MDSATVRANAAHRLANLATKSSPTYGEPVASRLSTSDKYPFFYLSSAQLATALIFNADPLVLKEIVTAVLSLSNFAKDREDTILLRVLIDNLAEANRTAFSMFTKPLAEYDSANGKRIDRVDHFRLLCTEADAIPNILANIRCRAEYLSALPPASEPAESRVDKGASPEITKAIKVWIARMTSSRDALSDCLNGTRILGLSNVTSDLDKLQLQRCFLVDSYINSAHLKGARFNGAFLQYSDLAFSDMRESTCNGTSFDHCNLRYSLLTAATILYGSLSNAKLNDTRIANLTFDERLTTFENTNWWDADFIDPKDNSVDQALIQSLQKLWPRPDGTLLPHSSPQLAE